MFKWSRPIASPGLAFALFASALLMNGCQTTRPPDLASPEMTAELAPFLSTYCYDCHDADLQKGGLDFSSMMEAGSIQDPDVLERLVRVLAAGEMPPKKKKKQPEPAERDTIVAALRHQQEARIAAIAPEPGRVTVRRLNRVEYNNTVRDLLGVDVRPAYAFPPDDTGYGFDNIGDVLSLSPLLAEKYLDAAEQVAREAVTREAEAYVSTSPHTRKVLVCNHAGLDHDSACADRILRQLAPRAYRRPVTREELERLKSFYQLAIDRGDTFYDGIGLAIQAMLVSPSFLFRMEEEQAPGKPGVTYRVNNYEYASRLSYFLWASMPDDELMACARSGRIRNPRTLRAQIRRMLADPRARSLGDNFAGQWLEVRNLATADPDPDLFPAFNDDLRNAMAGETSHFFDSIVSEDRSILDLIGADYTFVNGPLAKLYSIDGIEGDEFQRVTVDPEERGGILGQAGVLTVTSYPTRTSPVLRGKWILDNVLAEPPPAPPANVPPLEAAKTEPDATLRERLEIHRENASCATCHDRIDPLGFGLENYGPIGAWRTEDHGKPVDSTGELPDGRQFSGPGELKKMLLGRKRDFARCLTEKMLTYALGRGLEEYDTPTVESIVDDVEHDGYQFSALVYAIARSLPFTQQRGDTNES